MSFHVFIKLCTVALLAAVLVILAAIGMGVLADHTRGAPIKCGSGKELTCAISPMVLTSTPAYDLYRVADNAPAPMIECKTGYPKLLKDGKWDCGFPEPALKWAVPPEPVVTLARGAGTSYLTINKDNVQLVVIDMDTGHVKLAPGKSNEAARQFWKAVEANFPVCEKKQ